MPSGNIHYVYLNCFLVVSHHTSYYRDLVRRRYVHPCCRHCHDHSPMFISRVICPLHRLMLTYDLHVRLVSVAHTLWFTRLSITHCLSLWLCLSPSLWISASLSIWISVSPPSSLVPVFLYPSSYRLRLFLASHLGSGWRPVLSNMATSIHNV